MCVFLTPVLFFITSVIIEIYLQCFTKSVSLRDIGKSTSRAEISSPGSLNLKAVKGALNACVLKFQMFLFKITPNVDIFTNQFD